MMLLASMFMFTTTTSTGEILKTQSVTPTRFSCRVSFWPGTLTFQAARRGRTPPARANLINQTAQIDSGSTCCMVVGPLGKQLAPTTTTHLVYFRE